MAGEELALPDEMLKQGDLFINGVGSTMLIVSIHPTFKYGDAYGDLTQHFYMMATYTTKHVLSKTPLCLLGFRSTKCDEYSLTVDGWALAGWRKIGNI